MNTILGISQLRFKRDLRVPQASRQRFQVVGDFVTFCIGVGRVDGEDFVGRVFWVEFDEQFMVVEPSDSPVKRCRGREPRYVAQGCSGSFTLLDTQRRAREISISGEAAYRTWCR